jgi:hypothetical protein
MPLRKVNYVLQTLASPPSLPPSTRLAVAVGANFMVTAFFFQ